MVVDWQGITQGDQDERKEVYRCRNEKVKKMNKIENLTHEEIKDLKLFAKVLLAIKNRRLL